MVDPMKRYSTVNCLLDLSMIYTQGGAPNLRRLPALADTMKYWGFTDIEFNPQRSINCQARSAALFLSLMKRGELDEALQSPSAFIRALSNSQYRPQLRADDFPPQDLFARRR